MSVVAVLGPTAGGKSELALHLAEEMAAEVVSVDSMQVYRGMDIGTAKPSRIERARVPHHLVDVAEPEDAYTAAEFQRLGVATLERLTADRRHAIIVGGSGLHFRALVDPMEFAPTDASVRAGLESMPLPQLVERLGTIDPGARALVDVENPRRVVRALEVFELTGRTPTSRLDSEAARAVAEYRPRLAFTAIGLDPGPGLRRRVEQRFDRMLEAGLVEEVRALRRRLGPTARHAVGYKQLIPVVDGVATLDEARRVAVRATLGLAKRQRTYFRRDPRIMWLPWQDEPTRRVETARRALSEVNAWSS